MRHPILLAAVCAFAVVGTVIAIAGFSTRVAPRDAKFVGSAACTGCHPKEAQAYAGSDHDLAMDIATDATVLGHFDGSTLEHDGVNSRMHRDGQRYLVTTDGPDGRETDFEVSHVFGVRPLQQYLVTFPDGRLQCLPIAWDTGKQRWFHLYPDEHLPPDDVLHWTGPNQNWNWMCADCHSTDLRRNYDAELDRYDTRFSDIDVGCEACHGAGSQHLAWASSGWWGRLPVANAGLPAQLNTQQGQLDVCARCHARRGPIAATAPAGEPFHDVYRLELLGEGLYEADGTMRDEVYVTGSFLQSRMFHAGVTCTDCHDPHTTRRHAEGNALCLRCHEATRYDQAGHHHHQAGSEGALCAACHMPQRIYMQVDRRRDHSFRVPRPDLSLQFGTPNACNDCHRDRDARWAADATASWRGANPPYESPSNRQSKWASAFSAHRRGLSRAVEELRDLALDREQPGIVRATALDALASRGDTVPGGLGAVLEDADPLVRAAAAGCAANLSDAERIEKLVPLLRDPLRRVRLDAAQALASIPLESVEGPRRAEIDSGVVELEEALQVSAERPESVVTLGALREERGDLDGAELLYRRALRLQPRFVPALLNLSVLLDRRDRASEAIPLLERAVDAEPDFGASRYSLALALASQPGREHDALIQLERAVELMPLHGRAHYNLGLLRARLGDGAGARSALLRARELLPDDPDVKRAIDGLGR